ncbi:MAG: hypothetical protein HUK26_00810 [Duodenibacillus sp.]|nr:hypothetical protein [Duodenibacillus sp.]
MPAIPPNKPFNTLALAGPSVGALTGVIAGGLASLAFGTDYDSRLAWYLGPLLWTVAGAIVVAVIAFSAPAKKEVEGRDFLLYVGSTWLWPIPLAMALLRKLRG